MLSIEYNIERVSDSLNVTGKFFQQQAVNMHSFVIQNRHSEIVFFVLFGLLTILAFIRFFYPDTLKAVFSLFLSSSSRRDDEYYNKPGWAVPLFLTINFFISTTLLLLILFVKSNNLSTTAFTQFYTWLIIGGGVIIYYVFNQFSHLAVGFLFNTQQQARLQNKNTTLWSFITGIFLTPLLLIYSYTGSIYIIDTALFISGILLFFKWFQTFRIGLSAAEFHPLHIILYLCTVEIIPLLLLVKIGIRYAV